MSGNHSEATKTKISESCSKSAWRRTARDKGKPGEPPSAVGSWEEDFRSPSLNQKRGRLLYEEYPLFSTDEEVAWML